MGLTAKLNDKYINDYLMCMSSKERIAEISAETWHYFFVHSYINKGLFS